MRTKGVDVEDLSAFYSTTAQIIPVFILVFVIENRQVLTGKVTGTQTPGDVLLGLTITVAALVTGETAAVLGLLGIDSSFSPLIITFALITSLEMVTRSFLRDARNTLGTAARSHPSDGKISTRVIVALALAVENFSILLFVLWIGFLWYVLAG